MQTIDRPAPRIDKAERPLWFGGLPRAWGDVLRTIDPNDAQVREPAAMRAPPHSSDSRSSCSSSSAGSPLTEPGGLHPEA